MTVGLLGGSFNPAHAGHRHISLEAIRRLGLDGVWWLITPGNPLKDNDNLPNLATRTLQCAEIASHPSISISTLEDKIGSSYTANTIRHILAHAPGVQFVWLMGGDNLASFHRWERWQEIAAAVPLAILDRPGARLKALASPAAHALAAGRIPSSAARTLASRKPPAWTYLDIPLSDASSTDLRNKS